jgi:hypothetical protein
MAWIPVERGNGFLVQAFFRSPAQSTLKPFSAYYFGAFIWSETHFLCEVKIGSEARFWLCDSLSYLYHRNFVPTTASTGATEAHGKFLG